MRAAALLLALAAALSAQEVPQLVKDLQSRQPPQRQRAIRALLAMPQDRLPVAELRALLPDPTAAGVLCAFPGLRGELAGVFAADAPEAWLRALPAAPTPWLMERLAEATGDGELRARALGELQDRRVLRGSELAALLGDADDVVARTAASVLIYEWAEWPNELWPALAPRGRSALLQALAESPRLAGAAFAVAVAGDDAAALADRLLAVAALPPAQIDRQLCRMVARACTSTDAEVRRALRHAAARVPDGLADSLLGELHQLLIKGAPAEDLLPVLDRLGPKGQQLLLGICAAVDEPAREVLVRPLVQGNAPALVERARAALDGKIPLEPWLLGVVAPLLDSPARIERTAALLSSDDPRTQLLAYDTLRQARIYVPAMLRYAQQEDGDPARLRLLCDLGPDKVPVEVFKTALQADEATVRGAVMALQRSELPPALEPLVAHLARGGDELGMTARQTLLTSGSEAAARVEWDKVRKLQPLALSAIDWLGHGRRPWVPALWLTELAAGSKSELTAAVLDQIRLSLAESGDRRSIDDLIACAAVRSATFVRRCRHALGAPSPARAGRLLDAAAEGKDGDTRVECLLWAAGCDDAGVQQRLLELWRTSDDLEVLEAAVRGLMAGSERAAMLQELRLALQHGRFDDRMEVLAFEAVASMQAPLASGDVELLARLLLQAPLFDADAELRRAEMFVDGRAGFPMASAVADRLRRDTAAEVEAPFQRVALEVAALPAAALLAPQRLLCLWTAAAPSPRRQRELGEATAALLLRIPDLDHRGDGPAHWFLGLQSEAALDFAVAAGHYQQAAQRLLRLPRERLALRIYLGDRDVTTGRDPWAALAARAALCRARAALGHGDPAAARQQLAAALELAGFDSDTQQEVRGIMEQCK